MLEIQCDPATAALLQRALGEEQRILYGASAPVAAPRRRGRPPKLPVSQVALGAAISPTVEPPAPKDHDAARLPIMAFMSSSMTQCAPTISPTSTLPPATDAVTHAPTTTRSTSPAHEARRRARDLAVVDRTNPCDNAELQAAIGWAMRSASGSGKARMSR